jgi:hypothetical protein
MGKYLCLTAGEIGPVADASKLIRTHSSTSIPRAF